MTPHNEQQGPDGPSRLVGHFQSRSVEDHGFGWTNLWDTDNSDLWDRGKPSPALIDIIEQRSDLFLPCTPDGRRKKVLVPVQFLYENNCRMDVANCDSCTVQGCGKGYDVVMLALHGFDAYGIDISATGVATAKQYASTELREPQAYNFGNEYKSIEAPGNATFIQGDFFKPDWEAEVFKSAEERFDLIYDYTFLCALHPSLRQQWAARMGELIGPGGQIACLEYPMFKDPTLPGPPWGLKGAHWDLLSMGGDGTVNVGAETTSDSPGDRSEGQFERILYVNPSRSHAKGQGTDMLSVYTRK